MDTKRAVRLIRRVAGAGGRITLLTGAGVSAASGVPTFRGPKGFWTPGSPDHVAPQRLTRAAFEADPGASWRLHLELLDRFADARPNASHHASAELEATLGNRFTLVTQNVDGLHRAAGSSDARTLEIHGNMRGMRCSAACTTNVYALPGPVAAARSIDEPGVRDRLTCFLCGAPKCPHVLRFDDTYAHPA